MTTVSTGSDERADVGTEPTKERVGPMRIAVVSAFFSDGMGYTENCLPRALAKLGHDVHVVTSVFNVYGNTADYERTYQDFLGPRRNPVGTTLVDGVQVHRLDAHLLGGYVKLEGLSRTIRDLRPDIVHSLEIASLETFELAALRPRANFELFCETHQHMSVVRPYLKDAHGHLLRKAIYRLTRTLPTFLASLAVNTCYAIAPDCVEVATRFYGVPLSKVKMQSLGADTDLFRPCELTEDVAARQRLRARLGFENDDVVCVYSGRFSEEKNPLLLARAIDRLADARPRLRGLFIGQGVQQERIAACRNVVIVPFMQHRELAEHYRAADIAVWPTQESMSMLDAAACGLPLVVSDTVGEMDRVTGNGLVYRENDVASMADKLTSLTDASKRRAMGAVGRSKMVAGYSWIRSAKLVEADYIAALTSRKSRK